MEALQIVVVCMNLYNDPEATCVVRAGVTCEEAMRTWIRAARAWAIRSNLDPLQPFVSCSTQRPTVLVNR